MTMHRQPGRRITVFCGESDTYKHRPLAAEIVQRAHAAGVSGVSVFRGVEGFGSSHSIHTARILSLSADLPVAVVIVDTPEVIEDFLPQVAPLLDGGMLTVDNVEIVRAVRPVPATS